MSKRRRSPVDSKWFPPAEIKDSLSSLDGKTGFTNKNWLKMKVIGFHLPGNPFALAGILFYFKNWFPIDQVTTVTTSTSNKKTMSKSRWFPLERKWVSPSRNEKLLQE